jgi:hypothetical protein
MHVCHLSYMRAIVSQGPRSRWGQLGAAKGKSFCYLLGRVARCYGLQAKYDWESAQPFVTGCRSFGRLGWDQFINVAEKYKIP